MKHPFKGFLTFVGVPTAIFIYTSCASSPELSDLQKMTEEAGYDVKLRDTDGDGKFESVDLNNDGTIDGEIVEGGIDTDGDGDSDIEIVDTDGNGDGDGIDGNGDGIPDATIEDENDDGHPDKIKPIDVRNRVKECGEKNEKKILVCKVPPGNPENEHEICVGAPSKNAHLNSGSYMGKCRSSDDA